jgi:hypothetical protein
MKTVEYKGKVYEYRYTTYICGIMTYVVNGEHPELKTFGHFSDQIPYNAGVLRG